MGPGIEKQRRPRKVSRRGKVPTAVLGVCAHRFYFGGHRLRRAEIIGNRGAGGQSLSSESVDFGSEPSPPENRPGSRRAAIARKTGEILLRDTDRHAAADVYPVCQFAKGGFGKLSEIPDAPIATASRARSCADSFDSPTAARRGKE